MFDLLELKLKVVEIVKLATNLVSTRKITVSQKETAENIVTSADYEIQRFLCQELKQLLPNAGFLCEENRLIDIKHDYIWVIDPIDGTTNFARGIPECSISVALVRNSDPILGVVYNISNNDLFTAVKNLGAELNNNPIKVSSRTFRNSLFCTAMSLYQKDYSGICVDIITEAYRRCNDIRRFGSCALELCYIAAGMCELYFEIRVYPWDYAAGLLILQEAGGILTGFKSEKLSLNKPTVLVGANTVKNHEILNEIVNTHLKNIPYKEEL